MFQAKLTKARVISFNSKLIIVKDASIIVRETHGLLNVHYATLNQYYVTMLYTSVEFQINRSMATFSGVGVLRAKDHCSHTHSMYRMGHT